MNRPGVRLGIALSALTIFAVPSRAQHTVAPQVPAQRIASGTVSRPSESVANETLDKLVTIELTRVSLKRAVDALAAKADVQMQYRASVVDGVSEMVSVHATNLPLARVLEQLLAGTRLQAISSMPNVVTIKPVVPAAPLADGAIVGTVRNAKTKAPIAGATVTIDDAPKGVQTDEQGTFRIAVTANKYTVTVRAVGFSRRSEVVTVSDGATATIDFALEPSASVLNEVIVTGTVVATERKAIPTPITVITAEEIEKRGITRVEQFLRGEVPGLIALETGTQRYFSYSSIGGDLLGKPATARVYSRGSASLDGSNNPIKTYIDGVELLDPSYLGTIDPKSIERIEIVTGPQAATIYGSGAMGGVMQIFTKRGNGRQTPDVRLSLKYGVLENNISNGRTPSHDHTLTVSGGSGPEFTYAVSGAYTYTGQWQPNLFARTYSGSVGLTHVRGPLTVAGTALFTSGSNGTTNGNGGSSYCAFGEVPNACYSLLFEPSMRLSGELPPSGYVVSSLSHGPISTSQGQTLSLNADYRATSIWQHHLTLGRTQNDFVLNPDELGYSYIADTLYRGASSHGQRTTMGYNMTLVPRLGVLSSNVTLGANGSFGDQQQTSGCLGSKSATSYIGCSASAAPSVTKSLDTRSWGMFGSWQLGVFDQLYLTLGLRGERNPSYGDKHRVDWTPTNGVTYTAEFKDVSVKLLGSYGRATRPPVASYRMKVLSTGLTTYNISEYVSQFEAPLLTPEYSRGPQGGIEIYYGNLGSITVNRYVQTITDLIQRIKVDSVPVIMLSDNSQRYLAQYQYQNAAKVRQQGWDGTASLNLGALTLKGTYSWSDSRVLSVNPTVSSGYRPGQVFRNLPTHTGNVIAGYAHGGTSITWVTNYVGSSIQYGGRAPEWLFRGGARIGMYTDRRLGAPDYEATPGYAKSDLAVSQRMSSWASATLNITNLGNDFGSDVSRFFPSLGRQTLIGVSLRRPTL